MSVTLPGAGSIPSRTSGLAPLFVFFDATATTHTLGSFPYHDIGYFWNFGDSSAGTWSLTGYSKNLSYGPIAAHVYETPGTYTWHLWGVDLDYVMVHVSGTITVATFSGTNYYVKTGGSDAANGLTPATAFATVAKGVSLLADNVALRFHRTDSFTYAGPKNLPATSTFGGIIGAYYNSDGTDDNTKAKPIITATTFASIFLGDSGMVDWRIMDLKLVGNGAPRLSQEEAAVSWGGSSPSSRLFALRIDSDSWARGFNTVWGNSPDDVPEECGFVDCIATNTGDYGTFFAGKKAAIMGFTNDSPVQHNIRIWHYDRLLIQHCDLRHPAVTKTTIKFHNANQSPPAVSAGIWGLCSLNIQLGDADCMHVGPENPNSVESLSDVIVELNNFIQSIKSDKFVVAQAPRVTVRCNRGDYTGTFWGGFSDPNSVYNEGFASFGQLGSSPGSSRGRCYHNTVYKNSDGGQFYSERADGGSDDTILRNNLQVYTSLFTGGDIEAANKGIHADGAATNVTRDHNDQKSNGSDLVSGTTGDFHLVSGSTLRNAGTSVPVFYGLGAAGAIIKIPQHGHFDLGAFPFDEGDAWPFATGSAPVAFGVCA
jgi:hypothetical protein